MFFFSLGEEEEAAEEEDEDELQLPALDALSSSPGKTGLCSVDQDSLSPGEDADTKGERERKKEREGNMGMLSPEC